MKQQATFAEAQLASARYASYRLAGATKGDPISAAFMLGRAIAILEGLVESPTDAIDIQLAQDLLADYRKWMES